MGSRRISGLFFGFIIILGVGGGSVDAGVSACSLPCKKGDVNDDGTQNLNDLESFVLVLLELNMDPVAVCASDLNGDGSADGGDIDRLVESLICGCGCTVQTDCPLGQTCVDGLCVPGGGADLEFSDTVACCVVGPYTRLEDGGNFTICGGFQGFTELAMTVRATGFAPNAIVDLSYRLTPIPPQACVTQPDCPPLLPCLDNTCVFGGADFLAVPMTDIGGGINQFHLSDILFASAPAYHGKDATLAVTITDSGNPSITASLSLCVEIYAPRFCHFGPPPPEPCCPPDCCTPPPPNCYPCCPEALNCVLLFTDCSITYCLPN